MTDFQITPIRNLGLNLCLLLCTLSGLAWHIQITTLIARWIFSSEYLYIKVKGVLSKNLQKPCTCGRVGYNSWGDGTYHVDTLGPTKL